MYKAFIRPILFITSPEVSHAITIRLLKIVCAIPIVNAIIKSSFTLKDPLLETEVAGIKFPNPVGLAAGFDKNADKVVSYLGRRNCESVRENYSITTAAARRCRKCHSIDGSKQRVYRSGI